MSSDRFLWPPRVLTPRVSCKDIPEGNGHTPVRELWFEPSHTTQTPGDRRRRRGQDRRGGSCQENTVGYKPWMFNIAQFKRTNENNTKETSKRRRANGLPCINNLSTQVTRMFKSYDVPVYHQPISSLRCLLVQWKDRIETTAAWGCVWYTLCCTWPALYVYWRRKSLTNWHKNQRTPVLSPTTIGCTWTNIK